MGKVRVRGRAPGPRQNQSENNGREISQGGPPCEISQAAPDASRAVPVLAELKFRDWASTTGECVRFGVLSVHRHLWRVTPPAQIIARGLLLEQ